MCISEIITSTRLNSSNTNFTEINVSITFCTSCDYVREVPQELRDLDPMGVDFTGGVDVFYQQYTEAYGIPILGKSAMSNKIISK